MRLRAAATVIVRSDVRAVRVAVHADFPYRAFGGEVYGEDAFTRFLVELGSRVERLVVLGRLDPSEGQPRYPLGKGVGFIGLPYYESLWQVRRSFRAMLAALARFWRVLDEVEVVWLLGPHPVQVGFACLAWLRGRRVALGVRQEFPRYVATRHPGRTDLRVAAVVLEGIWRAIARWVPVVVVGPALAHRYRRARHLLEITASLVTESDVVAPTVSRGRSYGGPLRILSVGRIAMEKNPVLLADVLSAVREQDDRWLLTIVGEGPLAGEVAGRLRQLGVDDAAELLGYVPFGPELMALYRKSHALLHVSWTEGLPQVLTEAFAAGLPAVATDVGGIREAVGDAALLVPPGDERAAAGALLAIADDADLRCRLIAAGHGYASTRTVEAEARKVADFLGRK
jgi:glycosyltransferase involved in cell wall biosynthesis